MCQARRSSPGLRILRIAASLGVALGGCGAAAAEGARAEGPLPDNADRAVLRARALARDADIGARPAAGLSLDLGSGDATRLRGGFLRLQIDDQSTLALRPRGGGLVLAYRSQF